jgi:ABC-type cobalamin/Fe3+-siderophores transport system ATPase subunit
VDLELAIFNYRPYSDSTPARLRLQDGFTALLGVNNSGKSSVLRFFYEYRNLWGVMQSERDLLNMISGARVGVTPVLAPGERSWFTGNDRPLRLELKLRGELSSTLSVDGEPVTLVFEHERTSHAMQLSIHFGKDRRKLAGSWRLIEEPAPLLEVNTGNSILTVNVEPLRKIGDDLARAMYVRSFRNMINVGSSTYYDLLVGDAFISDYQNHSSGPNAEENERVHDAIAEIGRIFEISDLQVTAAPDAKSLQGMVAGSSRRISELGSGFSHFVMLMINVLMRRPSLLLIDEPETGLHASLQLDLLTTLAAYCDTGVLFATHSVGLARAAADRIYTVSPSAEGSLVKPYEQEPQLAHLLGQLGFDRSPVLGFQTVLLVEGVTEVRTFQQWLRMFRKEHEVLLLPLGGDNLIKSGADLELQELMRMNVPIRAVIDSEKTDSNESLAANRVAFVETCQEIGITVHVLQRRATENYMTANALNRALGRPVDPLGPFESLTEAGNPWSKKENWRIAREMTKAELQTTDLGGLLGSL